MKKIDLLTYPNETNFNNIFGIIIYRIKEKPLQFFLGLLTSFTTLFVLYKTIIAFYLTQKQLESTIQERTKKTKDIFPKEYITKEGDYLWKIAEENYGSGFNAYDIALANKIEDPNNLPPGTKIILPKVTPRAPTKGEITAIKTDQVKIKDNFYVVQPGDSLSIIAGKVYGDINLWPTIASVNKIANPEVIEVGMVLFIPR